MKEFEGASLKSRVAHVLAKIGWRCINTSYRLMDMGIEIDEDENDFITRITGRVSETSPCQKS